MRSHSGRRGRAEGRVSTRFKPAILFIEFTPKFRELVRAEVGKNFALHIDHRREFLSRKANHLVKGSLIRCHIDSLIIHRLIIQPPNRFVTPPAIRFYE